MCKWRIKVCVFLDFPKKRLGNFLSCCRRSYGSIATSKLMLIIDCEFSCLRRESKGKRLYSQAKLISIGRLENSIYSKSAGENKTEASIKTRMFVCRFDISEQNNP